MVEGVVWERLGMEKRSQKYDVGRNYKEGCDC